MYDTVSVVQKEGARKVKWVREVEKGGMRFLRVGTIFYKQISQGLKISKVHRGQWRPRGIRRTTFKDRVIIERSDYTRLYAVRNIRSCYYDGMRKSGRVKVLRLDGGGRGGKGEKRLSRKRGVMRRVDIQPVERSPVGRYIDSSGSKKRLFYRQVKGGEDVVERCLREVHGFS